MFDNEILKESKTWWCALTLSESIQNLCDGTHDGLWGVSGLPPPLVPQKHLGTQRDLWDDRRSSNVKRRIEGKMVVKGEGPPETLGWGKEVRGSECQFNLMGVHPCRGAGDSCREATLICTNSTLKRQRDWEWGVVDDLWFESRKSDHRKPESWSGENCPALVDTPIHSEHQRGNRKWCNRFRDKPLHPHYLLSPPPDWTAGVTPALLSLSTPPSRLSTRCN